ncbi:MAG: hypothetical protein WD801_12885 [Gemmatimonadaceae bacterium]
MTRPTARRIPVWFGLGRLIPAIVLLAACTSWQPVTQPERLVAAEEPVRVRVVRLDATRHTLYSARVTADSVVGFLNIGHGVIASFSRDSVARLEQRRFSATRTVALVAMIPVAALLGLALMWPAS